MSNYIDTIEMEHRHKLLLLSLPLILVNIALAQNIESRNPAVMAPPKSSSGIVTNFGASTTAVVRPFQEPAFYIGAPTYGVRVATVPPGAFYRCSARNPTCTNRIPTKKVGAIGMSVDSLYSGKDVMVCGSGYSYTCSNSTNTDPWMYGACFQANSTGAYEVPNPCAAASTCSNTLVVDIMFVMDESGSVQQYYFTKALLWVNTVTANFRNEINAGHIRVGVVKFARNAVLSVSLQERSYLNLEESVSNIKYSQGATFTNKGIKLTVSEFRTNGRKGVPKLMVVVTDGESTDYQLTVKEAKNARKENITMVAVGVGTGIGIEELRQIAGDQNRVLQATNFDQLNSILATLTKVITASATVQLESKVSNTTSQFLNGQFGLSLHTPKNSSPVVGAVGSYDRAGSFAAYQSLDKLPQLLNLTGLETILSPQNISQLRDSYLGYSVTSGKYLGSSQMFVASGMPRYQSRGQVVFSLVDQILTPTSNFFSLHPNGKKWQLGAYYGHSVLTVDLNNDAYDDLLVSAPLYSDVKGYDQGRVFVYMNDPKNLGPMNWVSTNYQALLLSGSNAVGARFGMSITAVGDVDKNNFIDIVIGAPREALTSSSSGAIYLYYGSAQGLSENYKQRLLGSTVAVGLVSFGYALVKTPSQQGVDVNSDTYPDIVVSAPASDKVYALHSRPILDVTASVTVNPPTVNLLNCLLSNGSCADVTVCIKAVQRAQNDPPTIQMVTLLDLDSLVTTQSNKRVIFFGNARTTSVLNVTKFLNFNLQCTTYGITLNGASYAPSLGATIINSPLRLLYSYHLTSTHLNRVLSPIIDPLAAKFRQTDLMLTTGCTGADGKCVHDLSLAATTSIPMSSATYVIGATPAVMTLNVTIINNGPDHSFYTKILVQSPGLRLTLVNNPCVVKSSIAGLGSSIVLINKVASLFQNNSKCDIVFKFALNDLAVYSRQTSLDITARIFSDSNSSVDSNPGNDLFTFTRPLKYDVNLVFGSLSTPNTLEFNHSTSTNIVNSLTDPVLGGNATNIMHTYTIDNRGPNMLSSAWLKFTWPNTTKDGFYLFYLYDFQCLPSSSCRCGLANKLNPMNIPTYKPLFPSNFTIQFPPKNQAALPTLTNCNNVVCGEITCQVFNQSVFRKVVARAFFKLWLPSLAQSSVKSAMASSLYLNASASPIVPAVNAKTFQTSTLVTSWNVATQPKGNTNTTDIGAIIGAVLGGVALLAIVALAMWKLGFFNSKYQDKLQEAKAANDGAAEPGPMEDMGTDVTRSTADLVAE